MCVCYISAHIGTLVSVLIEGISYTITWVSGFYIDS